MIHDAKVEVTCDGEHCSEAIEIEPEYRYHNYSGASGFYDTSDDAIEAKLKQEDWVVRDGKHYCSEGCAAQSATERSEP